MSRRTRRDGLAVGSESVAAYFSLQETGPRRYGELRRSLANIEGTRTIAPRVLSRELKALTQLGLLERNEYRQLPPKVEYSLSSLGRSLVPVIAVMHQWGVKYLVRPEVLKRMRSEEQR